MEKLIIGRKACITKSFRIDEVKYYAELSKDINPIHYDTNYAQNTFFKKPIVHGLLVSSLFGGLLGSKLPGRGTIHLSQKIEFKKPVFIDEEVTAIIEIIKIRKDKPIITFSANCYKENRELAITGEAVVIYKGEYFK